MDIKGYLCTAVSVNLGAVKVLKLFEIARDFLPNQPSFSKFARVFLKQQN